MSKSVCPFVCFPISVSSLALSVHLSVSFTSHYTSFYKMISNHKKILLTYIFSKVYNNGGYEFEMETDHEKDVIRLTHDN